MMGTQNDHSINKLTFAQREGRTPLPEPMRLQHISKKFRQLVWLTIETAIQKDITEDFDAHSRVYYRYKPYSNIGNIFARYRFNVCEEFHTDIPSFGPNEYKPTEDMELAQRIIQSGKYHEVLTFIEYILRDRDCPTDLHKSLVKTFEDGPTAYFLIQAGNLLTVAPRINKEFSASLQKALKTFQNTDMESVGTHFRQAAEHLNKQQYPDSIVDSIHAVESVTHKIDPDSNATLGKALNSLKRHGILKHPLLGQALHSLYGFANNVPGLRHGLKDKESADVGLHEAVLLFGTCVCFADYLANEHRQLKKQTSGDS